MPPDHDQNVTDLVCFVLYILTYMCVSARALLGICSPLELPLEETTVCSRSLTLPSLLQEKNLVGLDQWAVVGDTFPVGCAFSDLCVLPQFFAENPDSKDDRYNSKLGIYEENCGLDKVMMSWGHDEYMYQVRCSARGSSCMRVFFVVPYRVHILCSLQTMWFYGHVCIYFDPSFISNVYSLGSLSRVAATILRESSATLRPHSRCEIKPTSGLKRSDLRVPSSNLTYTLILLFRFPFLSFGFKTLQDRLKSYERVDEASFNKEAAYTRHHREERFPRPINSRCCEAKKRAYIKHFAVTQKRERVSNTLQ